jgi:hypothetical protein
MPQSRESEGVKKFALTCSDVCDLSVHSFQGHAREASRFRLSLTIQCRQGRRCGVCDERDPACGEGLLIVEPNDCVPGGCKATQCVRKMRTVEEWWEWRLRGSFQRTSDDDGWMEASVGRRTDARIISRRQSVGLSSPDSSPLHRQHDMQPLCLTSTAVTLDLSHHHYHHYRYYRHL